MASHDVGESGLLQRLFSGEHKRKSKRKLVTVAGADGAQHALAAFPIKSDLCDGLPFMGCAHPTGAAIRVDPAELFE